MDNKLRNKLSVRIISVFVPILVIFALVTSIIGYFQFTNALNDHYAENGVNICRLAAQILKADDIEAYLDPEYRETEEYETTMHRLDVITQSLDVAFIYLVIPQDEDCVRLKFLFETANDSLGLQAYEPGYERNAGSDEYARMYKNMMEGKSESGTIFRSASETTTGAHCTAMIPVKDSSGKPVAILSDQRQMDALSGTRNRFLINIVIATLLTLLLAGFIADRILRKRLVKPIRAIASETVRFSRENQLPEQSLSDITPGSDEIKLLAMHVDRMEYAIMDYTENLKTLRSERDRIEAELDVASAIQKGIMPNVFPPFPERDEFSLFATMDPAREVGGDFYDFFFIDDEHLGLVMADVSGKGVPAALFMMVSKIAIKNRAIQGGTPGEILADVNRQLSDGNYTNMFVTTWLGILDVTTGELVTANAGHEYPVICREDGRFEFFKDKHGFVLAGMSGSTYREETIILQPGDTLFVYTDGVAEAANADDALYGSDRLLEALNTSPHAAPEELIGNVMASIRSFTKEMDQSDDITMMALQFKGHGSHLRTLKIPALVENLPTVTEWVDEMLGILDVPAKPRMQIGLAVEEVFVNIAKYAYTPGVGDALLRVGYEMDRSTVKLTFLDSGVPYDPLGKEDPDVTLSAEDRAVGGLGIYLVKQSMDHVDYQRSQDYNILTLKKQIDRGDPIA